MSQFSFEPRLNRRHLLTGLACGTAVAFARGAFAEELLATPQMTEGPFYPNKLPLDTDNDLLIINDSITPAVGEITHLTGRILSPSGEPIRGAFVEIWQVDSHGAYLHEGSENRATADKNFQGYGRCLADSKGNYYFRTVKPVAYPGRQAPHIHFAISRNGQRIYTTQMFVSGHPGNLQDGIFRNIRDPQLRESVAVEYKPIPDSKLNELAANFEIVLGRTPEDRDDEPLKGGIGPAEFRRDRRRRDEG